MKINLRFLLRFLIFPLFSGMFIQAGLLGSELRIYYLIWMYFFYMLAQLAEPSLCLGIMYSRCLWIVHLRFCAASKAIWSFNHHGKMYLNRATQKPDARREINAENMPLAKIFLYNKSLFKAMTSSITFYIRRKHI